MTNSNEILAVIWKRRRTFALVFVLVFAAAAVLTFALPKVYESSAYLLVSTPSNAPSDFEATQSTALRAKTYADLVQTNAFADNVNARLPFKTDGSVSVDDIPDSQLIEIKASDDSPEHARARANAYALAVVQRVRSLQPTPAAKQSLRLAQAAPLVKDPARPRPKLYLLLGAVLAFFVASAMALLRNRLDQRLDLDPSTTDVLGLPILARVPQGPSAMPSRGHREADDAELPMPIVEAFRLLLANLSFANLGKRPRTIAVVSASEAEGKSTACLSLGRAAAGLGLDTAIVDADLRRPSLGSMVRTHNGAPDRGLSNLLVSSSRRTVKDVAVPLDPSSLVLIAAGPLPPNPSALLASDSMGAVAEQAKESYELTIFDTPPLSVGADASLISSVVEGVILVIDVTKARRAGAVQAVDQLRRAQGNVLGVILNRVPNTGASSYYLEPSRRRLGRRRPARRNGAASREETATGAK